MSAFVAAIRPAIEKLLELARPRPGETVLVLGCGSGAVALLAAERVAPRGKVIAVDAVAPALAAPGVTFATLTGDVPPWKPASCDVVIVQVDSALFREHALGDRLRLAAAALKRGGRLALVALSGEDRNAFVTVPHALVPGAAPLASLRELARPDRVEVWYRELGFAPPVVQRIEARLVVRSARGWWQVAAAAAGWPDSAFAHAEPALAGAEPRRVSLEVIIACAKLDAAIADPARKRPPRALDALVAAHPHVRALTPAEAAERLARAITLDVRESDELAAGTIDGAIHVPRGRLELDVGRVAPDRTRPLIVISADGKTAVLAAVSLVELGYQDVACVAGGYQAWARERAAGA